MEWGLDGWMIQIFNLVAGYLLNEQNVQRMNGSMGTLQSKHNHSMLCLETIMFKEPLNLKKRVYCIILLWKITLNTAHHWHNKYYILIGFWKTCDAPILHKPFIRNFPLPPPILSPSLLCSSCFPVEYRLNIHWDDRERNERVGNENLLGLVCISQLWIFQFMLSGQSSSYRIPSSQCQPQRLCRPHITRQPNPTGWNPCDSSFRQLARRRGKASFFYLLHWLHLYSVWFCALPEFFPEMTGFTVCILSLAKG